MSHFINAMLFYLYRMILGISNIEKYGFRYSLSETRWGRKVGLMPLPSLRANAHKVIREILPYIGAQFAFKLGHTNFPTYTNCLHTTFICINSPWSRKLHFLPIKCKSYKHAMSGSHFQCLLKWPRCMFGGFSIL